MQTPTQTGQLLDAIHRTKQGALEFVTNFYAPPEQVMSWIERGMLSYEDRTHSVLIARRDNSLYHLYHVAASPAALSSALASFDSVSGCGISVVADLVGRAADLDKVAEIYEERGFREYSVLVRMSRMIDSTLPGGGPDPDVVFGEHTDAAEVCTFLDRVLDRFRDQIPDRDEIEAALARRNILIARRGRSLAGVLFFEAKGLTSFLRYWYVAAEFHSQGLGARLMKTYLWLCRFRKRILLWVVSGNTEAIAKYEHYGFRRENLVDRVMIWERNK